ncbi:uncharacterized protein L201_000975 [Kwoniella dendrophila CBS 6074]|uniref:SET domain-containing protein n=1 Tax=Kwoniella dendrophila CBS 6074 TaxID=1295534 RepID=A0AAX4JMJ3_9TREE
MPPMARKSGQKANKPQNRTNQRNSSHGSSSSSSSSQQTVGGHSLNDLFSPNSPPSSANSNGLFTNKQEALEILHQLCAFEHILMEFFATLDGLDQVPVRSSTTLKYDRQELFINPQTKEPARRKDGIEVLEAIIKRITQSQRDLGEGNIIPESYLQKIEQNFISALQNTNLRLDISGAVPGQVGLFVKEEENPIEDTSLLGRLLGGNKDETIENPSRIELLREQNRQTKQPSVSLPDMKGIGFELFSLPAEINDIEKHGFNDDLTFNFTHNYIRKLKKKSENRVLMGLGMARVINHHCERISVEWPLTGNHLNFNANTRNIGYMETRVEIEDIKHLKPGMEVFGFYSDEFAELNCTCDSIRHKDHIDPTHDDVPNIPGSFYGTKPFNCSESTARPRANSMDMDIIQMTGSCPAEDQEPEDRYSRLRTPVDPDREVRLDQAAQNRMKQARIIKSRKRNRRSNVIGASDEEEEDDGDNDDDDDIQFLRFISSSRKRGRRLVNSPEGDEQNQEVASSVMNVDEDNQEDNNVDTNADNQSSPDPEFAILTANSDGKQDQKTKGMNSDWEMIEEEEDEEEHFSALSKLEIISKIDELDDRVKLHISKLQNHEDSIDGIIDKMLAIKDDIRVQRKEIERCMEEQRELLDNLKRKEKSKGKENTPKNRPKENEEQMAEPLSK